MSNNSDANDTNGIDDTEGYCPICHEPRKNTGRDLDLPCCDNHNFIHADCLSQYINYNRISLDSNMNFQCPICRQQCQSGIVFPNSNIIDPFRLVLFCVKYGSFFFAIKGQYLLWKYLMWSDFHPIYKAYAMTHTLLMINTIATKNDITPCFFRVIYGITNGHTYGLGFQISNAIMVINRHVSPISYLAGVWTSFDKKQINGNQLLNAFASTWFLYRHIMPYQFQLTDLGVSAKMIAPYMSLTAANCLFDATLKAMYHISWSLSFGDITTPENKTTANLLMSLELINMLIPENRYTKYIYYGTVGARILLPNLIPRLGIFFGISVKNFLKNIYNSYKMLWLPDTTNWQFQLRKAIPPPRNQISNVIDGRVLDITLTASGANQFDRIRLRTF